MPDLKITDADFDDAISGLTRTKDGFQSMRSVGDELAGAVGHAGLSQACSSYVSSWDVNRGRIERAIDAHLTLLQNTKEAFDETERKLTRRRQGDNGDTGDHDDGGRRDGGTGNGYGGGSGGGRGGGSLGGGGGGPSVGGTGSAPTLGSTETQETKDANIVNGGGGGASLGGTETEETKPAQQVGGAGTGADLGDALPEAYQGTNKVEGAGANADIEQQLKEKGLPVFAVDGQVQRPLGEVEGVGTLLGSQGNPPTISAVVDGKGNVVDIADLKPEYDEKGNLVALNQVPVPADIAAGRLEGAGGDTKQPGVVDGSATAAPALDQRTQEAVDKVKELFGDFVDVAVSGGKNGAEPTLTVAGVSGIGLAALAALATMSRSGAVEGDSTATGTGETIGLRGALSDFAPEAKSGFEQHPATDRQNLIDSLLRDLSPEYAGDQPTAGAGGADLRDFLNQAAGSDQYPLGPGSQGDSLEQSDSGAQSLKDSLVEMEAGLGKVDGLGPDLPPASDSLPGGGGGLGGPLPAGSGGGDLGGPLPAGSGGDLGGPLPPGSGGGDLGSPLPGGTEAPAGATQSSALGGQNGDSVAHERRNAHMMGGMGMAAGMSAAGGSGGMTGAEEARRNEEARRLRDRLASSKENN